MSGKNLKQAKTKVDRSQVYNLDAALALVKESAFAKFDETSYNFV